MSDLSGLTEGRIVHYVLPDGHSTGQHRPAIVVRVWRDANGQTQTNGLVQLQVFTDGSNDGESYAGGLCWATSIEYSDDARPRTWHWIERA